MVETLGADFRRFALLNDPAHNVIEVVIEKKNGKFCFTHGWGELGSLYDIQYGAEVTLVNVCPSRYVIQVKDRYGEEISYPKQVLSFSLKLNRELFPEGTGSEAVIDAPPILYRHEIGCFKWGFAKFLTKDDVFSGVLVRFFTILLHL